MRISVTQLGVAAALIIAGSTSLAQSSASGSQFTHYPGFVKRHAVIEAATDKGLIVELIVRCPGQPGVLTYSKGDALFCGPDHRCSADLETAVRRLCR
jgi:hypothetical protein